MKSLNFRVLFLFLAAVFCLYSCGGDENDDNNVDNDENSLLIGTWHMDEIAIDGTRFWPGNTITFYANGTLLREDSIGYASLGPAGGYPIISISDGQYTYNANTGILSTFYKPRDTSGDAWSQTYNVVELSKERLFLTGVRNSINFTFLYKRME